MGSKKQLNDPIVLQDETIMAFYVLFLVNLAKDSLKALLQQVYKETDDIYITIVFLYLNVFETLSDILFYLWDKEPVNLEFLQLYMSP